MPARCKVRLAIKVLCEQFYAGKDRAFANKKPSKIKGHDFFNDPIERMYSITYWEIDGQVEAYYRIKSLEIAAFTGVTMGYAISGKYSDENIERNLNFQNDGIRTQGLDFVFGIAPAYWLASRFKIGLDCAIIKYNLVPADASGSSQSKVFLGHELMLSLMVKI